MEQESYIAELKRIDRLNDQAELPDNEGLSYAALRFADFWTNIELEVLTDDQQKIDNH